MRSLGFAGRSRPWRSPGRGLAVHSGRSPHIKASRSPILSHVDGIDWLALCRRIIAAQQRVFERYPTAGARAVYEGRGSGGDRTLQIDRLCEDEAFAELEALAAQGHSFTVISEERGEVVLGESNGDARAHNWIVIDPIDGSLNARRTIPSHSFCLAVADGPTMADVEFGYVYDFGSGEEFEAVRGSGARLDGKRLDLAGTRGDGSVANLEVVGLESAEPGLAAEAIEALAGKAHRLRVVGSIAITLCQVAAGRFDGMFSLRPCRSVDAAAAILIVGEAGGYAALGPQGIAGAGFALDERFPIRAATTPDGLETLRQAQELSPGLS